MESTRATVVFDFDGTITSSAVLFAAIYNELAGRYRCKTIREDEIEELRSISTRMMLKRLGIFGFKLPFILRAMKRETGKRVSEMKPVEGIREVMTDLKQRGHELGIISTNSTGNINTFLEQNGFEHIDHMQCDCSVFRKYRAIRTFLKTNRIDPDRMLYIADETRDIVACRRAKVKVAAVTWGYHSEELLRKEEPDYMVNEPHEIIELVEQF